MAEDTPPLIRFVAALVGGAGLGGVLVATEAVWASIVTLGVATSLFVYWSLTD